MGDTTMRLRSVMSRIASGVKSIRSSGQMIARERVSGKRWHFSLPLFVI